MPKHDFGEFSEWGLNRPSTPSESKGTAPLGRGHLGVTATPQSDLRHEVEPVLSRPKGAR